jgi:hypothetical protein
MVGRFTRLILAITLPIVIAFGGIYPSSKSTRWYTLTGERLLDEPRSLLQSDECFLESQPSSITLSTFLSKDSKDTILREGSTTPSTLTSTNPSRTYIVDLGAH